MYTPKVITLKSWDGSSKDFQFEHAARLLNAAPDCWKLDSNSKYYFKNGIIINRPIEPTFEVEPQGDEPELGNIAPKED